MLTPEYLQSVPDRMVELYAQAEADILADMARRINTYDYWIPAAEHQAKMLEEMGMVREEIISRLKALTGRTELELKSLMKNAGTAALRSDDEVYRRAGLSPPPIGASKTLQKTLQAGYAKTRGLFDNLTKTTANTASRQFEKALDRAYMQITMGGMDYNTAIVNTIKDLSRQGIEAIEYPSGHIDTIEVATRRATITGVNQTALKLQEARADEMGCDLVEVSAHAGARPSHAEWQGGIYSRSGKSDKYPDFVATTGYGTGAGLGGWNCSHGFGPYFEGMARTYSKEQLEEYSAKNYEYNGNKMTEYEALQEQRYIERGIRRWKREETALKAAGLDSGAASAKVREWQNRQKDFLRQTGLKADGSRTQVGSTIRLRGKNKNVIINKNVASVMENIKKQSWTNSIKPEDSEELFQKYFSQATERELSFWNRYGELVKGNFYDRNASGYYSPREKTVHLNIDRIDNRSSRIGDARDNRLFFHETGHLFDYQVLETGNITDRLPNLKQSLMDDVTAYANELFASSGVKQVKSLARLNTRQKELLINDLYADADIKNAVSDIIGGLTNNRVLGKYMHAKEYWTSPKALEQEAVAHMFEAMMMKGDRLETFQTYFPSSYRYFKKLFDALEV